MSKNFLKWTAVLAFAIVFSVGIYGCESAKEKIVVEEKAATQAEAKTDVKVEPVAEKVAVNADWHLYNDAVRGFSISYPLAKDSGVDAELGVTLPEAVGNKDRTLKIDSYMEGKAELDADGCIKLGEQKPSMKGKQKIKGNNFCIISFDEGAMGSTYRTYHYTIKLAQVVDVNMTVRFPNSVREYADCENDPDQITQKCLELSFDENRDTQLFKDIMKTFKVL